MDGNPQTMTSNDRKKLFMELAAKEGGVTPVEVYQAATGRGDSVTEEAYYNIARRLAHRGLLQEDDSSGTRRYIARKGSDGHWLDEDDLWELVDPDYPLLALTIADESSRQMAAVPQDVWVALREKLRSANAPKLFEDAICSYCRDLSDQIHALADMDNNQAERGRRRREADVTLLLLIRLCKHGLGLSNNAVFLPINVESAVRAARKGDRVCEADRDLLQKELKRRVADEPFIVDVPEYERDRDWMIGAVDGSTRGGVLSFLGDEGDLLSGHAPLVSINTAVGQVNRNQKVDGRQLPTFTRLPERPEDMQREDNRYTVMAKLLYPDMSDGKYMHAVWNAMDLVEARATLRLMGNWSTPGTHVEVRAADVVLRDGAIAPQDRDFSHYMASDTYGRIVRTAIETNWKIAKHCKEDGQTFAGVVKEAQLSVYGPVINWFASRTLTADDGPVEVWPLDAMNLLPDRVLLTHLLTSGRRRGDGWTRSCLVVRPFHSVTNFARSHDHQSPPSNLVMARRSEDMERLEAGTLDAEREHFWVDLFREEHDPFVQMLDRVSYAGFYVGSVPHLDINKQLPRVEFLVNATNREDQELDWTQTETHLHRLCSALQQNGFDVANEHSMFENKAKLDVLPSLLIKTHDTVKVWATDLLSRVQEYVGFYIARYVGMKKLKGLTIRPFKKSEFQLLYNTLKRERDDHAGGPGSRSLEERRSRPDLPDDVD